MTDLISIIVPIYNVKRYLRRCIDSITNQKYKNIEIILVDDGSVDGCGEICDSYKKNDNRIFVIHKKNGGLSDARNIGLQKARGKYIAFVDSDDYISPFYIDLLYNNLISTNSDIACCDFYNFTEAEDVKYYEENEYTKKMFEKNIYVANKIDALEKMMYRDRFRNSACAKLFKRELFDHISFPTGKLCEDLGIMYKLFDLSSRICISNYKFYYYMQRDKSIIHSSFNIRRMDGLDFAIEQTNFIIKRYSKIKKAAYNREFMESIYILIKIPLLKKYRSQIKRIKESIKKTRKTIILDNKSPIKIKILSVISYFGIVILKFFVSVKKFK